MSKKSKITAALLALHCGDSLGATLEFGPPMEKEDTHTEIVGLGHFGWGVGDMTDDSDMALALLKSIAKNKGFNRKDVIQNYLSWQDTDPKDIGGTIGRALDLQRGTNLEFLGLSGFNRRSNGSLMRCAPMAILDYDVELINQQTTITHAEDICKLCDQILIKVIQGGVEGKTKEEIYRQAKIDALDNEELYKRLVEINTVSWNNLKTSGYVIDSLCAAMFGLIRYDSLENGLIAVVNRGDDSDTVGAICGAVLGSFYGIESIPQRWLDVIKGKKDIEYYIDLYYG